MRAHLFISTLIAAAGTTGCAWDPPRDARQGGRIDAGFVSPDQGPPPPDRGLPSECDPQIEILHGRNATEPGRWIREGQLPSGADRWTPGCGGDSGAEAVFALQDAAAGRWTVSTIGSEFDTVLGLFDGCEPEQAFVTACNDDAGDELGSFLAFRVAEGETIYIVVDAYGSSDSGRYLLDVRHDPQPQAGTPCATDRSECGDALVCWWSDSGQSVCQAPSNPLPGGARCAPDGRLGPCAPGTICQGDALDARCRAASVSCPPGVEAIAFERFQIDSDAWEAPVDLGRGALMESCLFGPGEGRPTVVFQFTAPEAGRYRFETRDVEGFAPDTVLEIADVCDDPQRALACDDDGGRGTLSAADVALQANQTVYVKVSSFGPDELARLALVATRR